MAEVFSKQLVAIIQIKADTDTFMLSTALSISHSAAPLSPTIVFRVCSCFRLVKTPGCPGERPLSSTDCIQEQINDNTDPKKSLASTSISELAKSEVDQLLQTGLADFSLRELLGLLISSAGAAERSVYLEKTNGDKPNGSMTVLFKSEPFPSTFEFPARVAESSGQQACRRAIAAVTATKFSRCCWDCLVQAAQSMPLKTRSKRWDCPARNRIWNVWRQE